MAAGDSVYLRPGILCDGGQTLDPEATPQGGRHGEAQDLGRRIELKGLLVLGVQEGDVE